MSTTILRAVALITTGIALWNCSGGTAHSLPPAPNGGAASGTMLNSTARFTITIPARSVSASRKQPAYVSTSTESLTIALTANDQGFANANQGLQFVNLTPVDPSCSGSPLTCTIAFPAYPGNDTFQVTTYDTQQSINGTTATGNALSQNVLTVNVPAGKAVTIPLTLDGITAGFLVVPMGAVGSGGTGSLTGSSSGLFLGGTAAQLVNVEAVDAQGNAIIGSGSPTVTLMSSTSNVTVAPKAMTTFALQGVADGVFALTATATAATSTSGVPPFTFSIPLTYALAGGPSPGPSPSGPGSSGMIFVAVGGVNPGIDAFVSAVAAGTAFIAASIDPQAIAIGPDGTLFVSNGASAIAAYPRNSSTPSRTIGAGTLSTVTGLAADPSGNLYVAETGQSAILMWAPGDTTTPSRTISTPLLTNPTSVACDKAGNLYALDFSGHAFEFASGTSTLIAGFPTQGVDQNYGIAVDASGTVYQGSKTSQTIYEYLGANASNLRTITGLAGYQRLTIDGSGNLLVLTTTGIREYAASTPLGTGQTVSASNSFTSGESIATYPNLLTL
jgi:hypothetical protein